MLPSHIDAICWNCRGLGNLYNQSSPEGGFGGRSYLVFIIETKFVVSEMEGIKSKLDRQ